MSDVRKPLQQVKLASNMVFGAESAARYQVAEGTLVSSC